MLSSLIVVTSQVVTLFLLMGVGFAMAQLGRLYPDGVSQMSTLVLYAVLPCVIVHSFQVERTPGMMPRLLLFALIFTLSTVFCIAVAHFSFRSDTLDQQAPLRFALCFGNNGFMGLPLLLSILGQDAVIYGVVSVVVFNLFLWTYGVKAMGGKVTLRQALINPASVGLVVGLPLFLTGARLPTMVGSAVGFMADLNTPLAMIIIGAQMAGADLKRSFTTPRLYTVTAFRLLLAPLVPMLCLLPFHLDPMVYCANAIMCAVPVAGATGMFAQRFQRDTALAAQMVTLSTLLSVLTLPIVAVVAQALSGML